MGFPFTSLHVHCSGVSGTPVSSTQEVFGKVVVPIFSGTAQPSAVQISPVVLLDELKTQGFFC
jgi:hypothetical protein